MLKRLYDWTLSLAARKSAEYWLAFIAIIESSIFLVPADVLFLPMALAKPKKAYYYATIATLASVFGGILGYGLGLLAYESFIKPMLVFYGELEKFEHMKNCTSNETLWLLLTTSGLAHIPPIKIVTILAGVAQISFITFILSCLIARGARFYAMAWALRRWGEPIAHFIEKRLGLIVGVAAAVLIGLYFAVKYFAHSGSLAC